MMFFKIILYQFQYLSYQYILMDIIILVCDIFLICLLLKQ